jgi:hypothetical protein
VSNVTRRVFALAAALCVAPLYAVTYGVPPDREMINRSDAIVVGTAGPSFARLNVRGGVETVTEFSIDEIIKGAIVHRVISIVVPGGTYGERNTTIPGLPRFKTDERALLFLWLRPDLSWTVTDFALGRFTFRTDTSGRLLLVRQEADIVGWDASRQPHRERRRAADKFLEFLRNVTADLPAIDDYFVETRELMPGDDARKPLTPILNIDPYTPGSYCFSSLQRWDVFPSPVTFMRGSTGPASGDGAIAAGVTTWNGTACTNANLAFGGTSGASNGLQGPPDGVNSILFERSFGAPPLSCTANSWSGTLGIGGTSALSGTNTLGSETFSSITEGDVEMNVGVANCAFLASSGDLASAIAHEVGHAIAFRHADRNAADGPCNSATMECASSALMTATVTSGLNGGLALWDAHAVEALYPRAGCGPPPCTPPSVTSVSANPTSITTGQTSTLSVTATGTAPLSFQWYVGNPGDTSSPVPGGMASSINVSPSSTTTYWVRVMGQCAPPADSGAVTVTVTGGPVCTPPAIQSASATPSSINSGQTSTLSVSASGTSISVQWYQGNPGDTSTPVGFGPFVNVTPSQTTTYWARVSSGCGAPSADSGAVTITVTGPPVCTAPSIQSATATPSSITAGQTSTLSVSATGTSISVQWFQGDPGNASTPIGSGPFVNVTPLQTTTYWVRVSSGCGAPPADSGPVTVIVASTCPAPTITQPANTKIVVGNAATITVTASGTTPLTYQWFRGASGDTSTPIGTNSPTFNTGALTAPAQFWVRVTSGCGTPANSGTITVDVGPPSRRRAVRRT